MATEYHADRRRFLRTSAIAGTAIVAAPSGILAQEIEEGSANHPIFKGDMDILRLFAALEILETDFWQQYNELGGIQDQEVLGGTGNEAYTKALKVLDADMDQYVHDNTDDEFTHFDFINAYLKSKGAQPVNLDRFRTLRGSTATGVDPKKNR